MMLRHKYSEEELEFIKQNVKGITLKELTSRFNKKFNLNVTEEAIAGRKYKLGLSSGIVGGRFGQGNKLGGYNKGTKMTEEQYKKASATMFKKGNIPPNRREIGDERICAKDGYTYVKIQDGKLNKNWILKHRLIWEEAYGPIPKGYNVTFKDKNRKNIALDNLMLVSKAEDLIMNRKGLFSDNSAITETGVLIAKVINKANKRKKEERR